MPDQVEVVELEGGGEGRLDRWGPLLALLLLLAFHLCVNLWWLWADNHTIRTDEEGHMHWARKYHRALFVEPQPNLVERAIAVTSIAPGHPAHPPLLHLLGALSIELFGYDTSNMALVNTFMFLLALLGVYALCRDFLPPWEACWVVFVTSFTPLMYAGSRYFMTDYLSMAIVVWAMYALARSKWFTATPWVFLFAVLNGLGILTRTAAFLYVLLPSAVAFAGGMLGALPRRGRPAADWRRLGMVALHAVLTVVVSVGIFSPWYVRHMKPFYEFWAHTHGGGTNITVRALPDVGGEAPPAEAGEPGEAPAAPEQAASAAPAGSSREPSAMAPFLAWFLHPQVPWRLYPQMLINNAMFLPLFALALLGAAVSLFRRFRSSAVLYLFSWVIGAYLAFTLLFQFAVVRYALQVLPALSVFAALAVLALPARRARPAAMGLVGLLLVFTYGNLSVHAYGPLAKAYVPPAILPYKPVYAYPDPGHALWKDELTMAFSYSRIGPPAEESYKDNLIFPMLQNERQLGDLLAGEFANYLKINVRGMVFDQEHYWPQPNPYQRPGIPEEWFPRRKLRNVGFYSSPTSALRKLPNVDYVVYALDNGDEAEERAWQRTLEERGFRVLSTFVWPAFGLVPERRFGVLAKDMVGSVLHVGAAADIDQLGMLDLYRLQRTPAYEEMPEDLRVHARQRFEELVHQDAQPFQLNANVTLMKTTLEADTLPYYTFRMVFRVDQPFGKDWRMFFHGRPAPGHESVLPERCKAQGYHDWNFNPDPPTSAWPQGDYVIITHRIDAQPVPYDFSFGFSSRQGIYGQRALLGQIDLGTMQ